VSEAVFRAFVGLPIPTSLQRSLMDLQSHFRHSGLRGKWVAPENFHITLRFLGNITYPEMESLGAVLTKGLESCTALHLALDGTGVFPSVDRPSVVWAGVNVLRGDGQALYEAVGASAESIGLADENRPFHPHVTLFRLRQCHQHGSLARSLEKTRGFQAEDFWADSVALWRSELRHGGAAYHLLKEYPLKYHPDTV
jgi:RNA 2',3'-cyclic 3'-phosphodiesterase